MYIGDRIRMRYIDKYLPYAHGREQCCLDLGCGNKIYQYIVEKHGYSYEGIDRAATDEKILRVDLDNEQMIQDFIKSNFYSAIICVDVLEHLKKPLILLSYLADMLNTHGRIILHVPNANQTHIMIDPEPNEDHKIQGFEPLQIETHFGKFFAEDKFKIIPTFNYLEAMAWDINYILRTPEGLKREKLLKEGTERLITFKENFVPYGFLVIGDR